MTLCDKCGNEAESVVRLTLNRDGKQYKSYGDMDVCGECFVSFEDRIEDLVYEFREFSNATMERLGNR